MEADFWKQECYFVIYKGYFQTNGMLEYAIKREWSVQRNNVKYQIKIETLVNNKTVQITTDGHVTIKKLFRMLCNILSYECLYDGRFFAAKSTNPSDVTLPDAVAALVAI